MSKFIIDARPIQPREIGISVVFYFNPALVRKAGHENDEKLTSLIEQFVDEQFCFARPQLISAIKEYVGVNQLLLDKTRG